MKRLVIIEDQTAIREMLVEILRLDANYQLIGEAGEPVVTSPAPPAPVAPVALATAPVVLASPPPKPEEPAFASPPGGVELMPRVMPAARRALEELGLSARQVKATGPGGRLLKEDVLRHDAQTHQGPAPATPPGSTAPQESDTDLEIVRMTPMRRTIARRLVEAQSTAAILTTFNEIDMHAVYDVRNRYKEAFEKRHGVRLGFMSFFVKAAIDALKLFPAVNAEIRGDYIVSHKRYQVGVAVSTERGLVVPVVRDADRLSFAQLEKAIGDLAKRGRDKKLSLDELQGGTFTVTNGGLFGSLMSTPILNPPQTGVLGMHAVQDRPVVRDGQIVIRPMMYVALSYDHRLIDGREAVSYLKRVKEGVEDPARLLLDV